MVFFCITILVIKHEFNNSLHENAIFLSFFFLRIVFNQAGIQTQMQYEYDISSSSSAFPSYISGVHHFWVRFLCM